MKMKKNPKAFLVAVLIAVGISSLAQNKIIDSLKNVLKTQKDDTGKVNTLNRLCEKVWRSGQLDTALVYSGNAKALSNKVGYKRGLVDAYKSEGIIYDIRGDYSKALELDFKALAISQEIGNKNDIAKIYCNIGYVYSHLGDYAKALDYDFQSLTIQKDLGYKIGIASNLGNIGIIYMNLENYSKALEYEEKALAINEEIKSKSASSFNLGIIGAVYSEQSDHVTKGRDSLLKMAFIYYNKALVIDQEMGYKRGIVANIGNLGGVFEAQAGLAEANHDYEASDSLYKKALAYDFKALGIDMEMGDKEGIANRYCNIGSAYTHLKKYGLALTYLDSSINLSKEIGSKDNLKFAYNLRTVLDTATGNYKQRLEDYEMYIVYRDSLINEANTKKTVQSEMNFEFEQKQASEKAERDKKDAVADQERKKQLVIRNSFMGGFALMLMLAFFIFRGYRQKQKANEIISEQKTIVEEKQKEILDSIHYAKRIQRALLASEALLRKNLPEYFVLYKPKDIVSGDFYWATEKNGAFYLAVCDSTGHGVPGAFMSLLNISFLNEAITDKNIVQPNDVFNHVRRRLIENVSQDGGQDGMDGVLLWMKGTSLYYSAAYSAPIIIRNNEIIELNTDKMPVGASPKQDVPFENLTLDLKKGDTLYLFTDGYADQFGGSKAKKFMHRKFLEKLLAISSKPLADQKDNLNEEFEKWKGMLEQVDDVLVIGIKV